jgi:hypothetical protein
MFIDYRIAQTQDLENIYQFALQKLKLRYPNEMECMIKVWESRFRKESLEHYLKLGWSFIAETKINQHLQGYFIGQPLLFFEGQTQTLWVEDILAETEEIESDLVEIAYKLSKDKHFQKVFFSSRHSPNCEKKNIKFNDYSEKLIWCKTTK